MSGVLSGSISVFDGSIIPIPACQEAEVFTLETNRGERETKIEMRVSKERMQVVALRQDCGKMPPAEQHDGVGGRRQHSPADRGMPIRGRGTGAPLRYKTENAKTRHFFACSGDERAQQYAFGAHDANFQERTLVRQEKDDAPFRLRASLM
jgi:hypothetical protein